MGRERSVWIGFPEAGSFFVCDKSIPSSRKALFSRMAFNGIAGFNWILPDWHCPC
jgi:hypothetical protein